MKKKIIYKTALTLASASVMIAMFAGCSNNTDPEATSTPVISLDPVSSSEPAEVTESGEETVTGTGTETETKTQTQTQTETESKTETKTARQDGERFEETIILEGMEETVYYEHVKNDTLGYEMDYDYESFNRNTEADRERFISIYDEANNPFNYLEVKKSKDSADAALAAVSEALSKDYDIDTRSFTLDKAGTCTKIDASVKKGTNETADLMQAVYIIPAVDGSLIVSQHYEAEASEGFGRRFSYMVNTLSVIGGKAEEGGKLTDDQLLSAIRNYCFKNNPDLKDIVDAGEYPTYWEIEPGHDNETVVLFRSYTGAQIRYYINPASGDTYVTEFVPGITDEEQKTDESFNVNDYLQ